MLITGGTIRNMIPLWTIGALNHASYNWHPVAAIYQDRVTFSHSHTSFLLYHANIFNFFSFKILKRCLLISESGNYGSPGSLPRQRAVANATAYTPQSLLGHWFCMSTNSTLTWGSETALGLQKWVSVCLRGPKPSLDTVVARKCQRGTVWYFNHSPIVALFYWSCPRFRPPGNYFKTTKMGLCLLERPKAVVLVLYLFDALSNTTHNKSEWVRLPGNTRNKYTLFPRSLSRSRTTRTQPTFL